MNLSPLLQPIELTNMPYHMSVVGPDIWKGHVIPIKNSIEINSALRPGVGYFKRTRKQERAQIPRRLNKSFKNARHMLWLILIMEGKKSTPYHVIYYTIGEDIIELVGMTKI